MLSLSVVTLLGAGGVALALSSAGAATQSTLAADSSSDLTVTVHAATAPMTNITPHTGVTRTANCAAGTTLVGGGGYLRNASDPGTLPTNGLVLGGNSASTGSSPVDEPAGNGAANPDNWLAIANFTGVAENGDQATVYSLCAANGPTQTVVASTSTVGANATQQVAPPNLTTATCPAGTTLIGGGAVTNTPDQVNDGTTVGNDGNLKPMGDYPSDASGVPAADGSTSATSWTAYGSAGITTANDTVTAVALCTSDAIQPVQVARAEVSGPDAQVGTTTTAATAVCPAGTQMLGGGYNAGETVNGTSGLQPQQGYHMRGSYPSTGAGDVPADVADGTTDPSAWSALMQAGGQNLPTGSSVQLDAFAMCAPASGGSSSSPTPTPTPTDTSSPTPTPTPTTTSSPVATTATLKVSPVHGKGATGVQPTVKMSSPKATGTIQFIVDGQNVDEPVTVIKGHTDGPVMPLGKGTHTMTAQFTPADPTAFAPSTSNTVTFTV